MVSRRRLVPVARRAGGKLIVGARHGACHSKPNGPFHGLKNGAISSAISPGRRRMVAEGREPDVTCRASKSLKFLASACSVLGQCCTAQRSLTETGRENGHAMAQSRSSRIIGSARPTFRGRPADAGPVSVEWQGKKLCEKLHEDAQIVVLRCIFPPGSVHLRHSHPGAFSYTLRGGTGRVEDAAGARQATLQTDSFRNNPPVTWHEFTKLGFAPAVPASL